MDNYKDQFISHMIDEIQTPLKAILKFSDVLLKNKIILLRYYSLERYNLVNN